MPIIGTNVGQSIAGAGAAERATARAAKKNETRPAIRRRDKDELIVSSSAVDSPEAVRSLKGNEQEDAREDHQEHPAYTARHKKADQPGQKRLDIAG